MRVSDLLGNTDCHVVFMSFIIVSVVEHEEVLLHEFASKEPSVFLVLELMSEERKDESALVIWAKEKMLEEIEGKLRFVVVTVF